MYKTPKWIFTYSNGVVCCFKNRNPIALIFRKIYRFKFYVIKYNPQDPFSYRTFHIIGKVSEKRDLACIIKKHNKNALRLKCYNFRRVNAIVFLFSALHITPFLYGKILFGILHLLLASIATFDTPPGSNPP